MKKNEIRLCAKTSDETINWPLGKEILEAFVNTSDRLVPEFLYQWEDCIGEFISVSETSKYWAQIGHMKAAGSSFDFPIGLRWKRKKEVYYDAEIKHTQTNVRGQLIEGSLDISAQPHKKVDWLNLYKGIISAINPRYAILHLFPGDEAERARPKTPASYFQSGLVVDGKFPDIGWAMFYGEEFSGDIDVEAIESSGFIVERLSNGYLIKVTSNVFDVLEDYSGFCKRRNELKSLFRKDFFMT